MKDKANRQVFDERGVLGAVCRHGHIIRFRNLYTTGEPAKELAWLLKGILADTPGIKCWALTYDVACAMDKAFKTFALNEGITLHTAANRFHLHAHEYSCQVSYNPMLQPAVFGMTDGESVETAWSSNSHLPEQQTSVITDPAEHHAAQAKLRQGSALSARYHDMSRRLIKLQHRFRLTGYREDVATKAIEAEKDYFLSKPSSESQQDMELFETIQSITDIEVQWDALRQRFRAGDEISLDDMREFVENENLRQQLMEKKRELINKFHVREADWEPAGTEYLKYLRMKCGRLLIEKYNDILDHPEFESIANKPPQINVNVIKDARSDDDLPGFKSLRHIWGLFRELGEATGEVPEWISSERSRDGMVSYLAIQAVEGELSILKRELMRIVSFSKARIEDMMAIGRERSSAVFVRRFFFEYHVFQDAVTSCNRIVALPEGTDTLLSRASEYLQELRSPRSSGPWEEVTGEVDMDLDMEDVVDDARRGGHEDPFNDDLYFGSVDSDEDELSETEVAEIVDTVDDEVDNEV
ncbi:hypothetical protein V1506DRAFT_522607 [Lipomyces tetrasporus]